MESIETAEVLNTFNIAEFGIRAAINLLVLIALVFLIYYPKYKNKDFIFTFSLFNVLNFLICFLLGSAKIKVGFAFGLFAIFSIMRYRTVAISIKDMGFLFVSVALGMINALATISDNFVLLIGCNLFVLLLTWLLDRMNFMVHENVKEIIYDNIALIKPANRNDLIADLKEKTGINIHRVEIVRINYLKDIAVINVYYYAKESEGVSLSGGDND